ncbi:MAG: hypothetical protein K2J30_00185, partial [Clostridia bacterium]|nr:hypothetical protein [Clostridia bacterium]
MESSGIKRAVWEVARTALLVTVFNLFAMAIAAIIVKAVAPSDGAIVATNWSIKCISVFLLCLAFVGKERALIKGAIAGVVSVLLSLFAFAAIGGGFHVSVWFILEFPVCAILGGLGALLGARLKGRA